MFHSPDFFPVNSKTIFVKSVLYCIALAERLGDNSWQVACAACCHMILLFAILSVNFFKKYFFFNLVLMK